MTAHLFFSVESLNTATQAASPCQHVTSSITLEYLSLRRKQMLAPQTADPDTLARVARVNV